MSRYPELERATRAPAEAALALPFSAYRDPDLFELEMARAFRGDWVAVCAEAQLAEPGNAVALAIGGEPVVVLRGRDGALRALSNVCRHRGTPLLDEGFTQDAALVCPYHAWSYADDGSLRGAPHTGNVEVARDAHALPVFALEVWCGVVFVNVDGAAPPLSARLAGVGRVIEAFGMARYDVLYGDFAPEPWQANWKLAYENGIEAYHLFRVHRETLELISGTRAAYYVEGGAQATVIGGPMDVDTRPRPGEPASFGERERGHYLQINVPPSFVGLLTRDSFGWIALHPVAPDRTHVVAQALVPADLADPRPEKRAGTDPYTVKVLSEDRWICERGQRGIQSRHSAGGQLVELERPLGDFHHYLGDRLFGSAARKPTS